jgi:hypothetical protein
LPSVFSESKIFIAGFRHESSNIYLSCGCTIGWENDLRDAAESLLHQIVEANYEELHKGDTPLDRDLLIMAMIYIIVDMDFGSDYLYALITTHHPNHKDVEKLQSASRWIEAGLEYLTREVLLSMLLLVRHDAFLKMKEKEHLATG